MGGLRVSHLRLDAVDTEEDLHQAFLYGGVEGSPGGAPADPAADERSRWQAAAPVVAAFERQHGAPEGLNGPGHEFPHPLFRLFRFVSFRLRVVCLLSVWGRRGPVWFHISEAVVAVACQ